MSQVDPQWAATVAAHTAPHLHARAHTPGARAWDTEAWADVLATTTAVLAADAALRATDSPTSPELADDRDDCADLFAQMLDDKHEPRAAALVREMTLRGPDGRPRLEPPTGVLTLPILTRRP